MRAHLARLLAVSVCLPQLALSTQLSIPPVEQQTSEWCWLAVGEMVFRYYGVANINPTGDFQCGIVALTAPQCNLNCGNCPRPAGSWPVIRNMLVQYSQVASQYSRSTTLLSAGALNSYLSLAQVIAEINNARPVIAGITPSGPVSRMAAQHAVLIIGYEDNSLIVNDPFPFDELYGTDPYTAAGGQQITPGRYEIDWSAFVTQLHWTQSVERITCRGGGCLSHQITASDGATADSSSLGSSAVASSDQGGVGQTAPVQVNDVSSMAALISNMNEIASSSYRMYRTESEGTVDGEATWNTNLPHASKRQCTVWAGASGTYPRVVCTLYDNTKNDDPSDPQKIYKQAIQGVHAKLNAVVINPLTWSYTNKPFDGVKEEFLASGPGRNIRVIGTQYDAGRVRVDIIIESTFAGAHVDTSP